MAARGSSRHRQPRLADARESPHAPDGEAPLGLRGVHRFFRVSESLWRGAQPTRDGFAALAKLGARTVVNLRTFHSDRAQLAGLGLRYVHIHAQAWNPEDEDLLAFLAIVRAPRNRPVFVHCQHGVDRTGVAVAVYRMVEQGWSREAALDELQRMGFHGIWQPTIGRYLARFTVSSFRRALKLLRAPVPELVR